MMSSGINNTMAILLLASVVTLVGGLMVIPASLQQSASADPDRCTSEIQFGLSGMACGLTKEQQQQNREACRELQDLGLMDKCSSSQTEFGNEPNEKPPKQ
jgi:hypothetical protein